MKIKVFLLVNAQLGWLDIVIGVPQAHFLGFLLVSRVRPFPQAPAIGWKILLTVRVRRQQGKLTNETPNTAASQSTFIMD
jgi:hypothetical protein